VFRHRTSRARMPEQLEQVVDIQLVATMPNQHHHYHHSQSYVMHKT
jgi:hypothetical protein